MKTISLCIIAYNEEKFLPKLLLNIKEQDYPHEFIEIVLVDGMSADSTKNLMLDFQYSNTDFKNIIVLDNLKRIQPAGLNVAIKNATSELILRIDAHNTIPFDFVTQNVRCIERGEDICGGRFITTSKNGKADVLFIANNSLLGGGGADFRNSNKSEYVRTLSNGCYKREIFDKVGLYNEKLARSEDNEIHYRMRKAGYKFRLSSDISSEYVSRSTLKGMIKQKYGNGKYVGLTTKISPFIFSWYHYVPFLFFFVALVCIALFGISFLGMPSLRIPFYVGVAMYVILDMMLSIKSAVSYKNIIALLALPLIFPLLHFAYGFGTVIGFLKIPFVNLRENK